MVVVQLSLKKGFIAISFRWGLPAVLLASESRPLNVPCAHMPYMHNFASKVDYSEILPESSREGECRVKIFGPRAMIASPVCRWHTRVSTNFPSYLHKILTRVRITGDQSSGH